MTLPDYSEYLKQPGMLAWIEKEWKNNPHIHDEHARIVNKFIKENNPKTIIEIGCGTGELATKLLLSNCNYTGYDSNEQCILLAQFKKISGYCLLADIRQLDDHANLIISFGFLKHFGLHEWSTIFKKCASFGEYFIFDMPIAYETRDDADNDKSLTFHHVWKSRQDMINEIEAAGMELLDIINPSSVEPIFICKRK